MTAVHRIGPDCWVAMPAELELFNRDGAPVVVYQATIQCAAVPGQELPAMVVMTQAEYNRFLALDVKAESPASFITTSQGMAGWFAVLMWWNPESGGFWEPYTTGHGRYATEAEAADEGQGWAKGAGMEFRLGSQS